MTQDRETEQAFLERAHAGDGQFAIAYAVLRLSSETAALRRDLCLGTSVGEGAAPGVLEMIAIHLGDAVKVGERLADRDP